MGSLSRSCTHSSRSSGFVGMRRTTDASPLAKPPLGFFPGGAFKTVTDRSSSASSFSSNASGGTGMRTIAFRCMTNSFTCSTNLRVWRNPLFNERYSIPTRRMTPTPWVLVDESGDQLRERPKFRGVVVVLTGCVAQPNYRRIHDAALPPHTVGKLPRKHKTTNPGRREQREQAIAEIPPSLFDQVTCTRLKSHRIPPTLRRPASGKSAGCVRLIANPDSRLEWSRPSRPWQGMARQRISVRGSPGDTDARRESGEVPPIRFPSLSLIRT